MGELPLKNGSLKIIHSICRFMMGAYTSLFQMPLYDLGDIDDLGCHGGMCLMFCAIGTMVGPPISGVINNTMSGFITVRFYAGTGMAHMVYGEPLTKPTFQEAWCYSCA
jgi:hypothetical protein